VAGQHQSQQLVAQLAVGERLALLGAGAQQEREDVAASLEVAGAATLGDHRVGRPGQEREAGPGWGRPHRRIELPVTLA
jgi:hypothetical protein